MNDKYRQIEKLLRQTAQARQDTKAAIAKLNAQRKDYSDEYGKVVLDPLVAKNKAGLQAAQLDAFEKISQLLEDLRQVATAKGNQLKLDNPAWANALKLIELSGSSLDGETVRKINASFAGDQSALRALRDVYKAHGVIYNGGLEEQIYEPESAFEKLGEHAYSALIDLPQ